MRCAWWSWWWALVACDGLGGCAAPGESTAGRADAGTIGGDAEDAGANTTDGAGGGAEDTVCERWRQARADRTEGRWTGSRAACEPGAYEAPGPEHTLAQVNLFRSLAGLPAVALAPELSAGAQRCALMMDANEALAHTPPARWACYGDDGARAAGRSNLATLPAVAAVDLYMTDQDVDSLGHRRWLLSDSLGPIGVGSTDRFSCLQVIGGAGRVQRRWTAWPPPGEVPYAALFPTAWEDTDAAGWSVQSDLIDLRAGTATVMRDGRELAVAVRSLDEGFGSTWALGITPVGWHTERGATYTVAIGGVAEPITWTFTVRDCR